MSNLKLSNDQKDENGNTTNMTTMRGSGVEGPTNMSQHLVPMQSPTSS